MFREVWNEDVSSIYQDILSTSMCGLWPLRILTCFFLFFSSCRGGGAEVWQAEKGGSICRTWKAICIVVQIIDATERHPIYLFWKRLLRSSNVVFTQ
jgi:hypothetical protein